MHTVSKPKAKAGTMAALLIILQDLLYGFGDPITKIAYESVPVFSLLAVRYTIALTVLLLIFGRRILQGLRTARIRSWLVPGLCIGSCYILSNIALSLTDATAVAFLRSLSTVFTPLLMIFTAKARMRRSHIFILGAVLIGLYLLCCTNGLKSFGIGEILALCSALLMAGSLEFARQALDDIDPIALTAAQAAISALLAMICAFIFNGGLQLQSATLPAWGVIFYLGICCTMLGYLLQNQAMRTIPSRTVALIQCACPVLTAVFSFILLHETLSVRGIIGAVIILVSVILEIIL